MKRGILLLIMTICLFTQCKKDEQKARPDTAAGVAHILYGRYGYGRVVCRYTYFKLLRISLRRYMVQRVFIFIAFQQHVPLLHTAQPFSAECDVYTFFYRALAATVYTHDDDIAARLPVFMVHSAAQPGCLAAITKVPVYTCGR